MKYVLDPPLIVHEHAVRAICRIEETSGLFGKTVFLSARKTPVALLVQGDGWLRVFGLEEGVADHEAFVRFCRENPDTALP